LISVNRRVENAKKDIIYYIGNPDFLSATTSIAAENVEKVKTSSNYIVSSLHDTEIVSLTQI
jgi:hypothetical protein